MSDAATRLMAELDSLPVHVSRELADYLLRSFTPDDDVNAA